MSVNAAFSIFKPNPLYRNLRDDGPVRHHDDVSISSSDHHDGKLSVLSEDVDDLDDVGLRDVDDDLGLLTDQVRELTAEKAALETRLAALERLTRELQQEKTNLVRQSAGNNELADLVAQLAAEKAEMEKRNTQIARQMEDTHALDKKTQGEANRRQSELADCVAQLTSEKAELLKINEVLEHQIKETKHAPAAITEEDSAASDELVALINELTSERDRLLSSNESLAREKDDLQRRHDELEAQPRVDDELASVFSGLETKNDELEKQNQELQAEIDEVYDLMEQMNEHIESLETHQHSLVAYVNKVCNDVKNVKRRGVWQKIEYDKERQLLVEELYSWKRRAEELQATEKDAVAAAEATAAWEVACLNQTIEQLQGEILTIKTELDETKEEMSRRGGTDEEAAETEQMLEAVQELALDLKAQVDEANAALDQQKSAAATEIEELREAMRELKQRAVKDAVAHDKERQELIEEILMWKNSVLEASGSTFKVAQGESASVLVNRTAEEAVVDTVPKEPSTSDSSPSNGNLDPHDETNASVDNQIEAHSAEDVKVVERKDETPLSTASESSSRSDSPVGEDNQKDHGADAADDTTAAKSKVSIITDEQGLENDDEDDKDQVSLLTPPHSDSFFNRLRSFSFRSRTDSISSTHGLDVETTTPSRSRANSTASSTTSTASSTKKAKAKAAPVLPPVTQYTRSDFMRQQEPGRMNSFKHFL